MPFLCTDGRRSSAFLAYFLQSSRAAIGQTTSRRSFIARGTGSWTWRPTRPFGGVRRQLRSGHRLKPSHQSGLSHKPIFGRPRPYDRSRLERGPSWVGEYGTEFEVLGKCSRARARCGSSLILLGQSIRRAGHAALLADRNSVLGTHRACRALAVYDFIHSSHRFRVPNPNGRRAEPRSRRVPARALGAHDCRPPEVIPRE